MVKHWGCQMGSQKVKHLEIQLDQHLDLLRVNRWEIQKEIQ
jgi:hypothetical protein